ncbi:MAG: hypothetical protein COA42_08660 [Alteromonadaceae bacterium]|nr:MAG: hypothetical protein COA42_08660 [Alteromonadaceae bacterium]
MTYCNLNASEILTFESLQGLVIMITCFRRIYLGRSLIICAGLLVCATSSGAKFFGMAVPSVALTASISECFVKGAIANQVQITESAIINDVRKVSGLPSNYLVSDTSSVNSSADTCTLKLV